MTASDSSVLIVATAWGTAHGGVNAFNSELCCAFARLGVTTTCVVTHADHTDIALARARGVTLLSAGIDSDVWPTAAETPLVASLADAQRKSQLWIGHDVITGPVMLAAHTLAGSKGARAIIHHMHYLSYKAMESSPEDAEQRHATQKALLASPDFVIAVGPKLTVTANDHMRGVAHRPTVFEILPGLTLTPSLPAPGQFQLFFAGRLSGKAARLKQAPLAAASFGRAISSSSLGADPILTMVGGATGSTYGTELAALAEKEARRYANVRLLPFTADRTQFLSRLSEQSAAMLLSVHEGFGLTAWEAIGAGVPLILSSNSGVWEVLHRVGGTALGCVRVVDVRASADLDTPLPQDIAAVADHVIGVARDPDRARRDAGALLEQLRGCTWDKTASQILEATGLRTVRPATVEPTPPPAAAMSLVPPVSPLVATPNLALFDIYTPECASYYFERAIDEDFRRTISTQSVWFWGPSGSGKTTLLRRWALDSGRYVYISLAACPAGALGEVMTGVYSELCNAFGTTADLRGASTSDLIRRIVRLLAVSPPSIVHVDELPDDSAGYSDICAHLAALTSAFAVAEPTHGTRFAFTTVADPRAHVPIARLRERLSFADLMLWSRDDIVAFIAFLVARTDVALSASESQRLCDESRGSPRFVKFCLRKLETFSSSKQWSFDRVITTSIDEVFI